ncbi:unnamed protein product [Brassicogethes aeneus]|uniref:Uncharacterized protein n=1 Tax=Brassicogethes aeneus TaxID=1431903 RepID=A0A9P0FG95_BRAAE|nr:unnamed protein product [Brassicogethes aeneus]
MSDSEECLSEPYQDSGSEYEPTTTNNKRKIIDANKDSSVDTDGSSCDSDSSIRRKGSGHKKCHFDKRQNEIPGTSSARNLDSPRKTDGTSVELDDRDDMPDDDDVQRTKSTRKRKANQKDWKKNIRKRLRQSGKEYKSCRGQAVGARAFRRNCMEKNLSKEARMNEKFYKIIYMCISETY